jgi:hypothetical protein
VQGGIQGAEGVRIADFATFVDRERGRFGPFLNGLQRPETLQPQALFAATEKQQRWRNAKIADEAG